MKCKNNILVATSLVMALSGNIFAQDSYTIQNKTLQEALEIISKQSSFSYVANDKLLQLKKINSIENIESVEKALELLLKGTGLKAIIKNKTIVITEDSVKKTSNNNNLGDVEIQGEWLGEATDENVKVYSGARTMITAENLEKSAALNIEDALRFVPGVQIQDETGTGVLPNISIRGLSPRRSTYLNALVNGIPAAIAPYSHTGFSLFPITMETLQAIDVVRGGAAVHYGPNNVGGVVNFVTKDISYEPTTTLKNTTKLSNGNVLNDTYARTGGFVRDDLGLQLQYNTVNGESGRDHSDTEVHNIVFDTTYYPTDNSELKFNLQYYSALADLPGALLPDDYEDNPTSSDRPYDTFDADTTRASLVYKINPSEDTEFHLMTYAQKSNRAFTWGWNTSGTAFTPGDENSTRTADREIDVFGIEPRFTFKANNHKVTFGARYINEDVDYLLDQTPFSTDITSVVRDWKIKTSAKAAYVSDTMTFMNGDLNITPGLRYENVHTDFHDNSSSDSNDDKIKNMNSFLPGLSLGYQATPNVFLFANTQRSLKAPQVASVRADGDLSVELAWNYEIGMRLDVNDMFSINSTIYRIDYKDQIEYSSANQNFENLGRTRHQGIETQFMIKPTEKSLVTLGYTYLDTEQLSGDNKGNKLQYVSSHQLSLSGDYSFGVNSVNLSGVYLSESFSDNANTREETDNGSAGIIPSYMLWNAKFTTEAKFLADFDTEVSFGVNNIFDEEYYFRGVDVSPTGRVSGQGRTFILSLKLDF